MISKQPLFETSRGNAENSHKRDLVMKVQMRAEAKINTKRNMITSMNLVSKIGGEVFDICRSFIGMVETYVVILRPEGPIFDTMSWVAFEPYLYWHCIVLTSYDYDDYLERGNLIIW